MASLKSHVGLTLITRCNPRVYDSTTPNSRSMKQSHTNPENFIKTHTFYCCIPVVLRNITKHARIFLCHVWSILKISWKPVHMFCHNVANRYKFRTEMCTFLFWYMEGEFGDLWHLSIYEDRILLRTPNYLFVCGFVQWGMAWYGTVWGGMCISVISYIWHALPRNR